MWERARVRACVRTPRRSEDIHAYGHKQQRVTHVWTMKVHLYHLNTPTPVRAGLCAQPPPARGRGIPRVRPPVPT